MKLPISLALALVTTAIVSPLVNAVTYYPDRASFDVAFPGLPVEDFEDATVTETNLIGPIDSFTNDPANGIETGDIIPGVSFDTDAPSYDLRIENDIAPTIFLQTPGSNGLHNFLHIFFDPAVTAVAFDHVLYPTTGSVSLDLTVQVFGSSGSMLDEQSLVGKRDGIFIGLSHPAGISEVLLSHTDFNIHAIDNLAFGVPEPSAVQLTACVIVMTLWRKRPTKRHGGSRRAI